VELDEVVSAVSEGIASRVEVVIGRDDGFIPLPQAERIHPKKMIATTFSLFIKFS